MDIAAFILSIISLIASVLVAFYEIYENRKLNNISLEAEYFDSLFKDYLLKEIPIKRKKIRFDMDSKLADADELIDVLNSIRHNSLYFQYADKEFYNNLKDALQGLEDFIVDSQNKAIIGEDQTDFFKKMQEKIEKIYDIMLKKYKGNKQKNK